LGKGKREGREREEGREGKGKEEGKGGEGEFASLALGGIDASVLLNPMLIIQNENDAKGRSHFSYYLLCTYVYVYASNQQSETKTTGVTGHIITKLDR